MLLFLSLCVVRLDALSEVHQASTYLMLHVVFLYTIILYSTLVAMVTMMGIPFLLA